MAMDYLLRAPVALIGLLLFRAFVYPRGWAGRSLMSALWAFIGVALTLPLLAHSRAGAVAALATAILVLFPYRRVAAPYMKARTRSGLRKLAGRWGAELREDRASGRWEVVRDADSAVWVGNVLTRKGSADPGIKKKEVGYMLAFVIELKVEPPFSCSLMFGWDEPRYFEREWRATHVIHGEFMALPFGDIGLAADKGRATGGKVNELGSYSQLSTDQPVGFVALGTNEGQFRRVFSPEFLAEFFHLAAHTFPFELNVTPTSVNIYTTYCDAGAQRACLEFLERLAARLVEVD
jgi:hypothetical protein